MAENDNTRTIKLRSPIPAHGEAVAELVIRRPTVAELRRCGQPYVAGVGGGLSANYDACTKLLMAVCAIPTSAVDAMDPRDFDEAAMTLVGFTMPDRPGETGSR